VVGECRYLSKGIEVVDCRLVKRMVKRTASEKSFKQLRLVVRRWKKREADIFVYWDGRHLSPGRWMDFRSFHIGVRKL
jgi:hypothetical protein